IDRSPSRNAVSPRPQIPEGGDAVMKNQLAFDLGDGFSKYPLSSGQLAHLHSLIDEGALFVSNHSGGKDSQAMLIHLLDFVPRSQILVVHASLGEMEWPGALELARKQAADAGVPFIV